MGVRISDNLLREVGFRLRPIEFRIIENPAEGVTGKTETRERHSIGNSFRKKASVAPCEGMRNSCTQMSWECQSDRGNLVGSTKRLAF